MAPRKTSHYGFQVLGLNDKLSENDYQFTSADKDDLDTLLYSLFNHHHNGDSVASNDPTNPVGLSLSTSGGIIGPGLTVRYKYSLIDVNGVESVASPEATMVTPSAIAPPLAPLVTLSATTGGTLLPGSYFYGLSAYVTTNTTETPVVYTGSITIPSGSTNKTTIQFPSIPSGSTGFNIYRRAPGETVLSYLASVSISGATPPTHYVDDGTTAENCNRQPSLKNVTNSQNSITVTFPGATPVVPAGYTWRLYRTYSAGNYSNTLLASIVTETFEGSGIISTTFLDTGMSTSAGVPRTTSLAIPGFDKIDLATESENSPPLANQVFPVSITLRLSGNATTGPVDGWWVCPYDKAQIVSYFLSADTPPSGTLLADIETYTGATPSWGTIFHDSSYRPQLLAGHYASASLDTTQALDKRLLAGVYSLSLPSRLRLNIISGATAATNVTLTINLVVQTDSIFDPFEFDA